MWPKRACGKCKTGVTVAPPPQSDENSAALTAGSRYGFGVTAQIMLGKYADHLPLYRLEDVFARASARRGPPRKNANRADVVGARTRRGSLQPVFLSRKSRAGWPRNPFCSRQKGSLITVAGSPSMRTESTTVFIWEVAIAFLLRAAMRMRVASSRWPKATIRRVLRGV